MTNKIKYIKLTNGQELVATVDSEKDSKVQIEKDAVIVFLVSGQQGQPPQVSLAPFAAFTDDKLVELDRKDIIFLTDANNEISDFFKQATGKAQILTPPPSKIII